MDTETLFIGASENNLPRPLSKDEVVELFKEVNNGSKEARNKLITHNICLVLKEVSHTFKTVNYDKKDLVSAGILGLINAVKCYDVSKGFEFSTYARVCIDNEIIRFLNELNKYRSVEWLDDNIFGDNGEDALDNALIDNNDTITDYETKVSYRIIRDVIKNLPKRDQEIVKMYFGFYGKTYTQREIGERFCITHSRVWVRLFKTLQVIKEELENQGIIDFRDNTKRR